MSNSPRDPFPQTQVHLILKISILITGSEGIHIPISPTSSQEYLLTDSKLVLQFPPCARPDFIAIGK